ncbi:L,D-transpeptidase family protein [Octadecabacter sp. 1_MG-2023]|uniref:L,D-transpeptidase family protein n=1 Tax=unclassified Octadecabacter TaxID=196158 RepID=UPI001C0A2A3D|nr:MULTISPECIES: L,D-transpeptidase family protein [unclassified Octadecabacter]MBU2992158.1 L,D-transpeptidase family protein [Octadecabacter sp. B2R22]MDO6735086.1 L,D-transpeptidase family protein [Octadecabacter sp. 1_MG-2023]
MKPNDLVVTPTHLRFMNRRFPCSIGKGGISDHKAEGDGATPRGTHRLVGMLYRPDRIIKPVTWAEPIHPRDLWSDDSSDAAYNQHVRAPYPHSHEALRRADPLYDLVIVTDWNWPNAVPGRGSAIFIHRWRKKGHPTEGCIGLRPTDLRWIAERISPNSRLIVL